ncbi:hypothetical protein LSS_21835 [Leptospira santarosai serovar Shermani str. LT 821]|uniref:Uncharacterized protein n=1 Tax=Leptospira santarosai serovar Shermani str. LT 821 TaxID=758847 RepID=A0A097ESP0_9LEPT|nr:hypothetical protein LSS_21835 [Leptospira santarosai serovar Shermani str. LT 821]
MIRGEKVNPVFIFDFNFHSKSFLQKPFRSIVKTIYVWASL